MVGHSTENSESNPLELLLLIYLSIISIFYIVLKSTSSFLNNHLRAITSQKHFVERYRMEYPTKRSFLTNVHSSARRRTCHHCHPQHDITQQNIYYQSNIRCHPSLSANALFTKHKPAKAHQMGHRKAKSEQNQSLNIRFYYFTCFIHTQYHLPLLSNTNSCTETKFLRFIGPLSSRHMSKEVIERHRSGTEAV